MSARKRGVAGPGRPRLARFRGVAAQDAGTGREVAAEQEYPAPDVMTRAVARYVLDVAAGIWPGEAERWMPQALAWTAWSAMVTMFEADGRGAQAAEDAARLKLIEMVEEGE